MNILSPEQIETYKKQGWRVFQPGFDVSYKSQWNTPWFIIREFFQNALDEHDEAGISAKPRLAGSSKGVVIEDRGRGLGAESLILRETKGGGDLRGRFGEGLKFACISAVRQGFTPVIESANVTIRAYASPSVMGKAQLNLLTFLFKETAGSRLGTLVTIEGYHGTLYTENFTTFLGSPIAWKDTQIGRFVRREAVYSNPKGNLYVGDIFIKKFDKPTSYSYNLWGIDLNPDRISEIRVRDVLDGMARPWTTIKSRELATSLIRAVTDVRSQEAEIYWSAGPSRAVLLAAWQQLFGQRAVLSTGERDSKLAEGYGYRVMGKSWTSNIRSLFRYNVPDASDIVEARVKELSAPTIIPSTRLTQKQHQNLDIIRFLTANCPSCSYEGRKPVIEVASIRPDPRIQEVVLGLCDYDGGKIYVVPSVLNTEEDTIATYYHEMGHWVGGEIAIDGSMSHT
jgi:hypothetical protein